MTEVRVYTFALEDMLFGGLRARITGARLSEDRGKLRLLTELTIEDETDTGVLSRRRAWYDLKHRLSGGNFVSIVVDDI